MLTTINSTLGKRKIFVFRVVFFIDDQMICTRNSVATVCLTRLHANRNNSNRPLLVVDIIVSVGHVISRTRTDVKFNGNIGYENVHTTTRRPINQMLFSRCTRTELIMILLWSRATDTMNQCLNCEN